MNTKKLIAFVLGIITAYVICAVIASLVFACWIMLADWLRNDVGFSLSKTSLVVGMFMGLIALFRSMPVIESAAKEIDGE